MTKNKRTMTPEHKAKIAKAMEGNRNRGKAVFDTDLTIRCKSKEKDTWTNQAGGKGKLANWIRQLLNSACKNNNDEKSG